MEHRLDSSVVLGVNKNLPNDAKIIDSGPVWEKNHLEKSSLIPRHDFLGQAQQNPIEASKGQLGTWQCYLKGILPV